LLAPGFIGLRTNRTPGYPWRVEIALTIISEIWPWIVESAIQQVTTLTGMNPSVTMAYDADSAADTFDKRNVRDGHYVSWGYEHLIVKLDGTTNEPSVAAVSAAVSATDPNNPMTIGACSVPRWPPRPTTSPTSSTPPVTPASTSPNRSSTSRADADAPSSNEGASCVTFWACFCEITTSSPGCNEATISSDGK
jgi:hypothetical protein